MHWQLALSKQVVSFMGWTYEMTASESSMLLSSTVVD